MMEWMRKAALKILAKPKTMTPEDVAAREARLVEEDILDRELELIESQFMLNARKAQRDHIINWIHRDVSRSVANSEIDPSQIAAIVRQNTRPWNQKP